MKEFINEISSEIKAYCGGRIFRIPTAQVDERFHGDGTRDYFVNHGNITDTVVISYYQNKDWIVSTRTFEQEDARGLIWFNDGTVFDKLTYWRVQYKPGYAIAAVPADLKTVAKSVLTRIQKAIEHEGVTSQSFGDTQTTFNLDSLFTAKHRLTMDRYKRQFIS